MLTRRQLAAAVGAAALAATLAAPQTAAQEKKTIKAVMHAPVMALDPIITTAYIIRNHGYMIYDTLFAMDANQKMQPQMVEKWELSADKLTYTFTLRDGLKWHDGAPVTTADVIPSLKRWGARDTMGQKLMEYTKELKAVDAKTFQLVLKEPYGLVIESIGKPSSNVPFIMPKAVAETPPDKPITDTIKDGPVIGSGPFRFAREEYKPGVVTVYVKNADYKPRAEPASWLAGGKVAKVDRVEYVVLGDPQTAANALAKGEIDYYEQPPYDLIPQMKKAKGVVVKNHNTLGLGGWLRINWLQPPFDNVKIRQAILHAVAQEEYLAAQVGDADFYGVCGGFFPCGTTYGFEDGAPHLGKPQIEKAKQLLKEGGYKGERIVVMSPEDLKSLQPLAPVTVQALRRIGMNVDFHATTWANVVARRAKKDPVDQGGWHIFHTFWVNADLLNPISNAGANAGGDKAWFGWPKDDEIEKLRDQFAKETDAAKQKAIAHAIHKRAYDVVLYVPTGQFYWPYVYRNNLVGVLDGPAQVFWNVEKK